MPVQVRKLVARTLLVGGLVVAIQALLWLAIGREEIPRLVASAVDEDRWGELTVNWECLRQVPRSAAMSLVDRLSETDRVWQEQDVPDGLFRIVGHTGDGRPIREYSSVQRLCVGEYKNTPMYAAIEYSLTSTPVNSRRYKVRWGFVLGRWFVLSKELKGRS